MIWILVAIVFFIVLPIMAHYEVEKKSTPSELDKAVMSIMKEAEARHLKDAQ